MPIVREKSKIRVQSFNGGEDSSSEASIVKSPFASLARGVDIDDLGKVKQRKGPARVGDNPDKLIVDMRFHDSQASDFKNALSEANIAESSITYEDGKFGISAKFNGTTSKIVVDAAETEISVNTMGAFVVTAWINPASDGLNDEGRIIEKFSGSDVGYRAFVHDESSGTVKLQFEVGYSTTNALVVTSSTIGIDTYSLVEFHHNADKSLDIIINGVLATYSTDTTGVGTVNDDSAVDAIIGNNAAEDKVFDGNMEYLRIYDGARSDDEYQLDKINGLTHYKVGSSVNTLYRIRDVHLEALDSDQKGWSVISGLTLTADLPTNFVQARDILFVLNGTDNVFSIDSANTVTDEGDTDTDPPATTVGAYAQNNRLFLAGSLDEDLRDYVWFSDTNDPQTFDLTAVTGNFFRVTSKKAGSITWLEPFKLNELIIYKNDSIFVLNMTGATPLTDWDLQPLNTSIGCIAGKTVKDIGNDHIFLDNEGFVRLLSRTTFDKLQTSVISSPVQTILDTINMAAMNKACAEFVNGRYYLAIPTGTSTENNVVLVWDSDSLNLSGNPASGWTVVSENIWYPGYFCTWDFSGPDLNLVHSDNRNISTVYRHNADTDDGKTITMEVAGPTHDYGERASDKIFGPLHAVWEAGQNTTVEMLAEIDTSGFVSLGTFSLAGQAPVLPIALPFQLSGSEKATELIHIKQIGRGKTCRIKARHANYNQTATFIEYELWAEQRIPKA